jgi:hypothetical protein
MFSKPPNIMCRYGFYKHACFVLQNTSILRLASQSWVVAAMQESPCAHKNRQGPLKFEYHNRSNVYLSTGDGMKFQELDVKALRDAVAAVRAKLDAHLIRGDWAAKELFDYGIYVLDEELSRRWVQRDGVWVSVHFPRFPILPHRARLRMLLAVGLHYSPSGCEDPLAISPDETRFCNESIELLRIMCGGLAPRRLLDFLSFMDLWLYTEDIQNVVGSGSWSADRIFNQHPELARRAQALFAKMAEPFHGDPSPVVGLGGAPACKHLLSDAITVDAKVDHPSCGL